MNQTPPRPDTSPGFVCTWIRRADGREPRCGAHLMEQTTRALEEYARARGTRLTGQPQLDFPAPAGLPRPVQREVHRAMLALERRPWRWPGLTPVRIRQDTEPDDRD